MDKDTFFSLMRATGTSDYEVYLKTHELFSCQTDFNDLCNNDELQFQIVHQIEELLMKLIGFTLVEIKDCMQQRQINKVVSLFKRVHQSQKIILNTLHLLGTMSPKEYQQIRLKLGRGSGRDSPGFKAILRMFTPLWETYKTNYLEKNDITLDEVYDTEFNYSDAYIVAECLVEFEILFQQFLTQHMQIVNRSIGTEAKSLNGNDVQKLNQRIASKFFPELWKIRSEMTDRWGQEYGYVRDSINEKFS